MPGADEISADDMVADVTIILLLLSNVHWTCLPEIVAICSQPSWIDGSGFCSIMVSTCSSVWWLCEIIVMWFIERWPYHLLGCRDFLIWGLGLQRFSDSVVAYIVCLCDLLLTDMVWTDEMSDSMQSFATFMIGRCANFLFSYFLGFQKSFPFFLDVKSDISLLLLGNYPDMWHRFCLLAMRISKEMKRILSLLSKMHWDWMILMLLLCTSR